MTPGSLPQRHSLVAQTATYLGTQIEAGAWSEWLPSERSLCELLQISRNTLRAALLQLQQQGRIRTVHGAGHRIVMASPATTPRPRARDVALLSPEPIERLRPMQSLWIDDMRALLGERGVRLRVFHGQHYYGGKPGAALQKLIGRNPHGCWILMLSGETMQRWFQKNGIPCVVAGSTYPGLELPFRDLDHRATCRHAAGVLLGLGHRRIALLTPRRPRAGDIESEAGFLDGVRQSRHTDLEPLILHHEGTLPTVAQAVQRLLNLQPATTGLLVIHPHYYLAAASRLTQAGVRIPERMSLISRDDDPFLSFVAPVPARYVASPHAMARSLLRPVLELLEGHPVSQRAGHIMPEFTRGESIGPAPAGRAQRA